MSDETIQANFKGLENFIKALKGKPPVARVGILGGSPRKAEMSFTQVKRLETKPPSTLSNATVGTFHEFGTDTLPQRSFLRVPIAENLQKKAESSGAFDKDTLAEIIKTGSLIEWTKKLGIIGESIVMEAFDTGGFGKWRPSNMNHKTNHQTLVETQQLRNSITSDVVE